MVDVRVNPRLPYLGFMGTTPKDSRDPSEMYIEVNPKHYESKKNLYLTVYHELIHAIDPTQTTHFSPKYMLTYSEKDDTKYWGHPIEFFAITNEFLEGLILEFKRRADRIRNEDNRKFLHKQAVKRSVVPARNQGARSRHSRRRKGRFREEKRQVRILKRKRREGEGDRSL